MVVSLCFIPLEKRLSHLHSSPKLDWGELHTLPIEYKWYNLGVTLGVESQELDHISTTQVKPFKCKVAMFKKWLNSDPAPSWEKLADALDKIGEGDLASDIRAQHGIETSQSSGYSSVSSSSFQSKSQGDDQPDGLSPRSEWVNICFCNNHYNLYCDANYRVRAWWHCHCGDIHDVYS